MKFTPTPTGGRIAEGKTPYGDYRVEWDAAGNLLSHELTIPRPAQPIPEGFDPEQEARRARQGGCCGAPSDE